MPLNECKPGGFSSQQKSVDVYGATVHTGIAEANGKLWPSALGTSLPSPEGRLKAEPAVTGNWRLVFRYDEKMNTASDIDLMDYH